LEKEGIRPGGEPCKGLYSASKGIGPGAAHLAGVPGALKGISGHIADRFKVIRRRSNARNMIISNEKGLENLATPPRYTG